MNPLLQTSRTSVTNSAPSHWIYSTFLGMRPFGRTVAVCFAGEINLGAAMVRAGQAVAYGAYQGEEREACEARRGVWASSFEHPAVWRARHPR
jgi:endonuclease YncB( thermonuclease family)